MDFSKLMAAVMTAYTLGLLGHLLGFIWGFVTFESIGKWLCRLGWISQSLALLIWYIEPGNVYPPWVGLPGALFCWVWLMVFLSLFLEKRYQLRGFQLWVFPFVLLAGWVAWKSLYSFPALAQYEISPYYSHFFFYSRVLAETISISLLVLTMAMSMLYAVKSPLRSDMLLLPMALFSAVCLFMLNHAYAAELSAHWKIANGVAALAYCLAILLIVLRQNRKTLMESQNRNAAEASSWISGLARFFYSLATIYLIGLAGKFYWQPISETDIKGDLVWVLRSPLFFTLLIAFLASVTLLSIQRRDRLRLKLPDLWPLDYTFSRLLLCSLPWMATALALGAAWNWQHFGLYWRGEQREVLWAILVMLCTLAVFMKRVGEREKGFPMLISLYSLLPTLWVSAFLWPESLPMP